MNKDKVIKDLRERNDKLQSQYYMSESRCYYAEHKLDEVRKLKIAKDKVYSELEDKYIDLENIIKNIKKLTKQYMQSGYIYEYNGHVNYYVDGEYLKGIVKILGDDLDEKTDN